MKLIFLNKKLHILFINSWYPSKVMPTNGDFIQRHAEAVVLKNDVTAIHIISDKTCKASIMITDEVINDVRTLIGYVKFTKNPILKWWLFIRAFGKIGKKVRPFDIVHVNRIYPLGIFALILKYTKKKTYVISEHWTGLLKNHVNSLSLFERWISKRIVKSAAIICPVSQNLKNAMVDAGFNGNYEVVPNVVDIRLFVPKRIERNQFTLLHVSNMIDQHKNISGMLRAMGQLKKNIPNLKFILAGENSEIYRDQLTKLSLQNTVELLPQMEHAKIAKLMQAADAFVLFSNYENLPCVILESFACGLPVISSNVGGISEFFPTNFGYLIPKQDDKKLIETLTQFYEVKTEYNGLKMHQYVKDNFSKEVICDTFSLHYKDALKL